MVGLGRHCCCHRSWWGCKIANGGRRNWRAGQGEKSGVRRMQHVFTGITNEELTWGSTPCSSCSCSCTGGGEWGSRPERERGCVLSSEEVWELPAGGAGTELPQTGWQAGWGKQRRLWGEIDLQANTKVCSFTPLLFLCVFGLQVDFSNNIHDTQRGKLQTFILEQIFNTCIKSSERKLL